PARGPPRGGAVRLTTPTDAIKHRPICDAPCPGASGTKGNCMTVTEPAHATDDVSEELRTWLEDNWDPDLTVGEWWQRLGLAGWSAPGLPTNAYGRGLARNDAVRVQAEIAQFGALG